MATIYIDNRPYAVDATRNLLHACLSLGLDIPYFCWHPALGSVGACRQCAVKQFKDEKDTRGRIVMSCMTPAADGTRLSIDDPEAKAFRSSVIEWLMINHPHDCPVCDEGGECHLQDMTVMTEHIYRRHRFKKRTFRNQYLGPFINHEMNRCIQCYRCVRFYRDYAGGRDLDVFAAHNHVYFGRHEDGVLENEFSGNLVEVCPTGVFTDKTLKRHYTRKWDLQTAPSVCVHCGLGCNTIAGERYGKLRRILNRYNGQVNGYFLCDRGRFGYEFVNDGRRIRRALLRSKPDVPPEPSSKKAVLQHLASLLADPGRVIGIGSPRASLEANFALRALVGADRFYLGIAEEESRLIGTVLEALKNGPARSPSLRDVERADAVLVLGEDVTNTAPMVALAIRQSVRRKPMEIARKLGIPEWDDAPVREVIQQNRGPLFIATVDGTRLDEVATETHRAAPEDLARLGFAVAHALSADAPSVPGLPAETRALAERIALALKEADRPLVVAGTSLGSEAVIRGAANVAWALGAAGRTAELCFTVPECNSVGLGLMGGESIEEAFQAVKKGGGTTVIVLENDLYRRANRATVDAFLDAAGHVVAIDHCEHTTVSKAEVVLPAGTFAEADGTLVNNEGRAQRFYQVFVPDGDIQESWRWVRDLMLAMGRKEAEAWHDLDAISGMLAEMLPVFKPITDIAPPAGFRLAGQKIPRQPHRYSGRTAMVAHITVHEPKPPEDPDSPLAFTMEGYPGQPPAPCIPRFWAPAWNSVQSLNKFQDEVGGPLRGGDPGRRLLEPATDAKPHFCADIPHAFARREDACLIVPVYHIFGSEELSLVAPGVAERSPEAYLALHPDDAARLGVGPKDEVDLRVGGTSIRLPVVLRHSISKGLAGLPVGLPGLEGIGLPAWGAVARGPLR